MLKEEVDQKNLIKYLKYDSKVYPFNKWIACLIYKLDKMEDLQPDPNLKMLTRKTDSKTKFHKQFYDNFYLLDILYKEFIFDYIRSLYDGPIYYQKIPNIRFHFPDNLGVGKWHKDSDFGHPVEEDNFYLPLTFAYNTNTLWAETEPGKKDYLPFTCEFGEIVKWKGSILEHGNKLNDTGKTRVSLDFRVIPVKDFVENQQKSINLGLKFENGSYYKLCQ